MSGCPRVTKMKPPPTRRSISQRSSRSPAASHQQATSSGRVQASKTRSGGAAMRRVKRSVCAASSISKPAEAKGWAGGMSVFLRGEMAVEIVEAAFPPGAERLQPLRHRLHARRLEPARAALRVLPAGDEPGLLQHLQMLRDGRLAERERPGELRHRGFAERQPGEDGAAGGIAEGGEGCVELHCSLVI